MDRPIVIVGAGRQGRLVAEILENSATAAPLKGFLDDTKPVGQIILGHPVLAGFEAMRDPIFLSDHAWIVAIGDNLIRNELCRFLADASAAFVNAVHPTANISGSATVGRGVYFGAFSRVSVDTTVGDWAIIEAHSLLGIDVRVGDAAFVGPASLLAGGSSVGARSFLGAATVLSNKIAIGADCVVGASSLVLRDVPDGASVFGTPARPARLNRRPLIS